MQALEFSFFPARISQHTASRKWSGKAGGRRRRRRGWRGGALEVCQTCIHKRSRTTAAVLVANAACASRGRVGHTNNSVYIFWRSVCKICLFSSSHTISSIIVACETRVTESDTPPEPNLFLVCSRSFTKAYAQPSLCLSVSISLIRTSCCVCIL